MKKTQVKFVGQAYKMPAVQLNAQTCVNWYQTFDPSGKFPAALIPDPGLEVKFENTVKSPVRGLFALNDILFAVCGDTFYEVQPNFHFRFRGTLKSSVGQVRMIANDNQIFLTDGINGYVYQYKETDEYVRNEFVVIGNTSSQIGDPRFDGSGLDDLTNGGSYTGSTEKEYLIQIDSASTTSDPDTFKWSDNGGVSFNQSGVKITGNNQTLNDGVYITFENKNSHTQGDKWTFSVTLDDSFYVPLVPAYQDTYGIYVRQNSQRWYISDINNFRKVNALDFALADAWADNLTVAISIREELWLIGRTTTEVWYNIGADVFPFERRSNLLIKYGCLAPYSVAVGHNNILFWLANNEEGGRVIISAPSYTPEIISTEPLNAELESYERVDDAIAGVYQWDGHIFYWITFPTADRTWVYDLTTKSWHEKRSTLVNEDPAVSDERQGRWRANCYAYYQGDHLFGDFESGKIFKLARGVYTEDGNYVLRERTTQSLDDNLERLSVYSLEIDMQKGIGLTQQTAQGHDPQISLQISYDGGVTWGNELWRSMTKTGKYAQRIKWNRLGTSDSFVFRVKVTDPVYCVLLGAVAEIEELPS